MQSKQQWNILQSPCILSTLYKLSFYPLNLQCYSQPVCLHSILPAPAPSYQPHFPWQWVTMAHEADLMGLGQHCSVPDCQQIDFLPFTCDCCTNVFCLDHRTYTAHKCPKAGNKQTEVIVCPMCAKAIKLTVGQDPNLAFEAHTREGCDPTNYARVHKKPRCPVPNCKEKLASINTYHCKTCGQKVCLKHRHGEDHNCDQVKGESWHGMGEHGRAWCAWEGGSCLQPMAWGHGMLVAENLTGMLNAHIA